MKDELRDTEHQLRRNVLEKKKKIQVEEEQIETN